MTRLWQQQICALTLTIGLIGCGGSGGDSSTPSQNEPPQSNNSGNNDRLVWEQSLPVSSFAYYSSPAISADEQTIYVGTAKNVRNDPAEMDAIVAFNRDGSEKWQYVLPNGEEVRSTPVLNNTTLYFTVDKRTGEFTKAYRDLIALTSQGQELWRQRVSTYSNQTGSGLTKVTTINDKVIYTGLDLLVFDAETGELLFERRCNCDGRQDRFMNAAINSRGELVYFDEGHILRFDPDTYTLEGEFKEIETIEGDLVFSTPAIDSNNNIYFGSEAGVLYSFDDNLNLRWRFDIADINVYDVPHVRSSVAIDESRGTLYFGTKANVSSEFYAIDMTNQSVKWVHSIPGDIYVSPAIGDNGRIYFSSESEELYAYNPDGELAWKLDLGVNVTWSSPALDSTGVLYIGGLSEVDLSSPNAKGKVFAVQTDSTGLMPNTWSKLHNDNQNTGRF